MQRRMKCLSLLFCKVCPAFSGQCIFIDKSGIFAEFRLRLCLPSAGPPNISPVRPTILQILKGPSSLAREGNQAQGAMEGNRYHNCAKIFRAQKNILQDMPGKCAPAIIKNIFFFIENASMAFIQQLAKLLKH